MRILFVCLGNICRSPTAEAALRRAAADAGLDVEVDSAGTGAYHVGEPPDPRMRAAAGRLGLDLDGSARRVRVDDFQDFDLIVAMDRDNAATLRDLAPDDDAAAKVRLFRSFEPDADSDDVPDPYYEGDFEGVVRIVQAGAAGIVDAVRADRL